MGYFVIKKRKTVLIISLICWFTSSYVKCTKSYNL